MKMCSSSKLFCYMNVHRQKVERSLEDNQRKQRRHWELYYQAASNMHLFSVFSIPLTKFTWQTFAGIQSQNWLEMETKKEPTKN